MLLVLVKAYSLQDDVSCGVARQQAVGAEATGERLAQTVSIS